eukprot:scaffold370_cov349-Pavlova_lutheri.AAC.40
MGARFVQILLVLLLCSAAMASKQYKENRKITAVQDLGSEDEARKRSTKETKQTGKDVVEPQRRYVSPVHAVVGFFLEQRLFVCLRTFTVWDRPLQRNSDTVLSNTDMSIAFTLSAPCREADEDGYSETGNDEDNWYYDDWDDEYYDDYNYDEYFDYPEFNLEKHDCTAHDDGSFSLNGTTACDILIDGADKLTKYPKFDGTYKVAGCNAGRPYYKKQGSKEGLFLWFSAYFRDWDVGTSIPSDDDIFEDNSLLFGGMGNEEARPEKVPSGEWYIKSELLKAPDEDMAFVQASAVEVKCKKGSSKIKESDAVPQKSSKDVEAQAQQDFNKVYNKYLDKEHKKNSKRLGGVARFLVELLVLLGIGGVIWVIRAIFCFQAGKGPSYQAVA